MHYTNKLAQDILEVRFYALPNDSLGRLQDWISNPDMEIDDQFLATMWGAVADRGLADYADGSRARFATAANFDSAAHRNARAFWIWLIIMFVTGSIFLPLAVVPAALSVWSAIGSIGATRAAGQLRSGTYPIFNLNNGAPDGDASNFINVREKWRHLVSQLNFKPH